MTIGNHSAQPAFNFITDSFTNIEIFGINDAIGIILVLLTLILITREYKTWSIMALPVMIGWKTAGIPINITIWAAGLISFALSAMQDTTIGDLLTIRKTEKSKELEKGLAQFTRKTARKSNTEEDIKQAIKKAQGLRKSLTEKIKNIKI